MTTAPVYRLSRLSRYALCLLTLFATLPARAYTLAEANALYRQGDYHQAMVAYELIAETEPSAIAYYNLGNACFKDSLLARSILAYERCLRLDPHHHDAQHNLLFAQQHIVDRLDEPQPFFLSVWATAFRNLLREHMWLLISITCFALCCALLLTFFLATPVWLRKTSFVSSCVLLVVSIITLICFVSLHRFNTSHSEAIVMQGIVNAKAEPNHDAMDLFTIHEGSKVSIRRVEGDWSNIQIGKNNGWLPTRTIEKI